VTNVAAQPTAADLRRLLDELARSMRLVEKSEVGCCGVTLSQCHVLLEVARAGTASPGEVAASLGLDLSTVSRVADGLVRRGLLERETDPRDRRRCLLSPTEAARDLVARIEGGMNAYVERILDLIPQDRRVTVLEALGLLVEAAKKLKEGCCP
ncbi:MAG: MarR family transcriptional regulator, partial [Firmicutes bacterium]|nr:MarR family transcriptional regulator [Bacillota bacterium]